MTRQLFLLRHAKSDWGTNRPDHDRPLNNRGRKAARDMGRYLQQQRLRPDQLYCSTAERARQTVQGVLQELDYPESEVHWEKRIYLATLYELLKLVAEWLPASNSIMLVGHNPGMEELLGYFVPDSYADRFPTAGFAQIQLPAQGPYKEGCGELICRMVPRQLKD